MPEEDDGVADLSAFLGDLLEVVCQDFERQWGDCSELLWWSCLLEGRFELVVDFFCECVGCLVVSCGVGLLVLCLFFLFLCVREWEVLCE